MEKHERVVDWGENRNTKNMVLAYKIIKINK